VRVAWAVESAIAFAIVSKTRRVASHEADPHKEAFKVFEEKLD
jgi:hypothetical protein